VALPRFKVESLDPARQRLSAGESRHAAAARRMRPGDELIAFDGRGGEARGRVVSVRGAAVEIELIERPRTAARARTLSLAVAMPKGARADWLVEKAAELGVAALTPLRTARTVAAATEEKVRRWRRISAAAAKQSRGAYEMRLEGPCELSEYAGRAAAEGALLLTADLGAGADPIVPFLLGTDETDLRAVVGPEGGWTDAELSLLRGAGARRVRLAATVLRVETAAVALAAVWSAQSVRRGERSE